MKKLGIVLLVLVIVVGGIFLGISYKKNSLENAVVEYLVKEEKIHEDDIVASDSFMSNLSGSRNFMVSVKLKNDDKTYFYYEEDGKIILESYVENGREYVQ